MEEQFQIISDGSCDLPTDLAEEAGISIVPFYVSFDEKNYLKEIREIGIRTFYQQMVENPGVYPKSSIWIYSDQTMKKKAMKTISFSLLVWLSACFFAQRG